MLNQVNLHRRQACAKDLQMDEALHQTANLLAHQRADGAQPPHSNNYNELVKVIDTRDPSLITRMRRPPKWILALSIALSLLAEMIVTPWFDENKQYNPQNEASAPSYSQLVWKGSTKLGIGHAYSGEKLFIVTLYEPSGNVRGQFASNVGCGPNERP